MVSGREGDGNGEGRLICQLKAKVALADILILKKILGRTGQDDRSILQNVPPVREAERVKYILLHQKDGGPLLVDLSHDPENGLDKNRRKA